MLRSVKRMGRLLFERWESVFDALFGVDNNPLYHLGALGWFFYWIVAVSGIYLYIFFDTGVNQAYESVYYLTHTQWYAGGVARSLHRYASDALIIVMLLHLLREYVKDRMRGPRWFAWVIGIAAMWLVFASGISGFWIVWDKLAQYVAIATSEWLDALPLFGQSIARNFLHDGTLSGRFFTLMVFIHIAVPLILLFVLWVHIQRVTNPKVNPPRQLAFGVLAMLLVLSLIRPVVSEGPAQLSHVTASINLDWFYMAVYPLLDWYPGTTVWLFVGVATIVLLLLPWLPRSTPQIAVVDLDNCNGCARCDADCPFGAITMEPRTDDSAYSREAVVSAAKCVGCGICVGACPTATPFRRRSELRSGIDLPDGPVAQLRDQVKNVAESLTMSPKVLIFGCTSGPDLNELAAPDTATVTLNCIGQLPPSFIDFVISQGYADGVLLTGCREGDCHYRLGNRWARQRIDGERDPYLRKRVPRERLVCCWTGLDRKRALTESLQALRQALTDMEHDKNRTVPSMAGIPEHA